MGGWLGGVREGDEAMKLFDKLALPMGVGLMVVAMVLNNDWLLRFALFWLAMTAMVYWFGIFGDEP